MPVDRWGNKTDVIMDGDSTIKRMNVGRVYEQYVNAASREVSNTVRKMLDNKLSNDEVWHYLAEYYRTASPLMGKLVDEKIGPYPAKISEHLAAIYKDGIYLWIPPYSPTIGDQQIVDIINKFPVPMGPVTYRGRSGNIVTTVANILIGSMYVVLLEKTGSDWAAVSSAKRQHFGLLAKLTNADKYSLPWREQPTRLLAEAEVRLLTAIVGSDITADLLEIPNSPTASKAIVRALLEANKPTSIKQVLDRKKVPRGGSRSIGFVKHMLECAGFEFSNE